MALYCGMTRERLSRREFCAGAMASGAALVPGAVAAERTIDDFFQDFTGEWVRYHPALATSARYFSGDTQDRLERQSTPQWSGSWRAGRVRLAKKGLDELRRFDRARLNEVERVSADLMDWQLDMIVREDAYADYVFPIQQMNGANVSLVESLTVRHPLETERDAANYNAVLGQAAMQMDDAIAVSGRQAGKNIVPPKFILDATIRQMQSFTDYSPAENPFVSTLAQKLGAVKNLKESSPERAARRCGTNGADASLSGVASRHCAIAGSVAAFQ